MKIACVTQKPIQTLILIYLLKKKYLKFDLIIYIPQKKNNNLVHEGTKSWKTLKVQTELMNVPFKKIKNLNDKNFKKIIKFYKIKSVLFFISDQIIKKSILKLFNGRAFGFHGGILPGYRGIDCNYWSILKKKRKVGISLFRLNDKIDSGDIFLCKTLKVVKNSCIKSLNETLFYKFKLNMAVLLVEKIKKNLSIKLKKNYITTDQYFEMHKTLKQIITN